MTRFRNPAIHPMMSEKRSKNFSSFKSIENLANRLEADPRLCRGPAQGLLEVVFQISEVRDCSPFTGLLHVGFLRLSDLLESCILGSGCFQKFIIGLLHGGNNFR